MDDYNPIQLTNLLQVSRQFDGSIITPEANDLNCMRWNINHLTNKLRLVEQYIAIFPGILHVIIISESWLTLENKTSFRLQNYYEIHSVRPDSQGGGISIFLHNSICTTAPKVLFDLITPDLNQFVLLELPTINTTIAVPYRRPVVVAAYIDRFLDEFERFCLTRPHSMIMGDFNLNQLNDDYREKLNDLLEMHGFALTNEISDRGITRLCSGTILDLCATNMLQRNHKLSIVHNDSSDHSILFASVNQNVRQTVSASSKTKFHLEAAVEMVEEICSERNFVCGNELNIALEDIVRNCTSVLRIKSDERIVKSHINRELVIAIRERDRLRALVQCIPNNDIILKMYNEKKAFVNTCNELLKSEFESKRIVAAAGNPRKTWHLYKEILFNKTKKAEPAITVNGIPLDDSIAACNTVNDIFCSAGEKLATSIIAIHGYQTHDVDDLYAEHSSNNWSSCYGRYGC